MVFFLETKAQLSEHLQAHALRTDGPFTLASGVESDWYLDGRQTTFDGEGARRVAACVLSVLDERVTAIGGMTMGADPIALAAVVVSDRPLKAFSIRKAAKTHGVGGRMVGPVGPSDVAAVVDDTVTTGSSAVEAAEVLRAAGVEVAQAIAVVDRSGGAAASRFAAEGIPYVALLTPVDLGVES